MNIKNLKNIEKRDGRIVPFDSSKIEKAISQAFDHINKIIPKEYISRLTDDIVYVLDNKKFNKEIPTVEEIQDVVENQLMIHGYHDVAKEYILYRSNRSMIRNKKSDLMQTYKGIALVDSSDNDIKRENANIDGDGAMGKMLKYGSEGSKDFYKMFVMPKEQTIAHDNGDIHIHDLDFASTGTTTCCQIDLLSLFHNGFSTGHGHLREPNSISSYSALACIVVQSNQNDQHGGQSIVNFDYAMAEGIKKSFKTLYRKAITEALFAISDLDDIEEFSEKIKEYMNEFEKEGIIPTLDYNTEYMIREHTYLTVNMHYSSGTISKIQDKCYKIACKNIDRETYQAMESFIHNLNTMHCLPYHEKLWVIDSFEGKIKLIEIGYLTETFTPGRYFAYSMNMNTGECEIKPIIAAQRKDNHRDLVTLTDNTGKKVTITTNHKVLSVNRDNGEFYKDIPENISQVISPRFIPSIYKYNLNADVESSKMIYANTPVAKSSLTMNKSLARLFGIYVADGSIVSRSVMVLSTADKYSKEYLSNLVNCAFGQNVSYNIYYMNKDKLRIKDIRFNVGSYMGDFFKQCCGENSSSKHVPQIIMSNDIIYQIEFLNGYLFTDGRRNCKYTEATSISNRLIKEIDLLIHKCGEIPYMKAISNGNSGYSSNFENNYSISLGNQPSKRIGLEVTGESNIEYPKYDLSFIRNFVNSKDLPRRHSNNIKYSELEQISYENQSLMKFNNVFITDIIDRHFSNSNDDYVYDISVADNENFMTEDCIFVSNSRAGAQVPFSSINYGMDTSSEGRMVIKNLLLATEEGLGNKETPIFPVQIYRIKEGINYNPEDPNYDLFKLAMRVSAKRLFPNFSFQDAPFNLKYYKEGHPETEIAYMGCRTRVIGNVYDPNREITYGRGNLSFTSINLPRLGIKANGDINKFYEMLDEMLELCIKQLTDRFKFQCSMKVKNFPFLMGQGNWIDSEKFTSYSDTLEEVLKHGTLSVGFIGLAETLKVLTGKHHGESEESQKLGLEIISRMRKRLDLESEKTHLNYTCLATPAEGLSGRFVKIDREKFGIIEGVTDRDYYTNSFHVPVYYDIDAKSKIEKEAPYHAICNAGHISYIELDGDTTQNLEAFEKVIRWMKESGIGYGAINHPVDRDPVCGFSGIINDECPCCGRIHKEGDLNSIDFERIRRITGYLVGTLDRFNDAKRSEESERVKHSI